MTELKPAGGTRTALLPPPSGPHANPVALPASFKNAEPAVLVTLNQFFTRYLIGLYKQFDGDVVAAIVLGEVVRHNIAAMSRASSSMDDLQAALARVGTPGGPELVPTNAFSIAQSTGIPRETVRRKVAALVEQGLMRKDARGSLSVALDVANRFDKFNEKIAGELLDVSESLKRILSPVVVTEDAPPR